MALRSNSHGQCWQPTNKLITSLMERADVQRAAYQGSGVSIVALGSCGLVCALCGVIRSSNHVPTSSSQPPTCVSYCATYVEKEGGVATESILARANAVLPIWHSIPLPLHQSLMWLVACVSCIINRVMRCCDVQGQHGEWSHPLTSFPTSFSPSRSQPPAVPKACILNSCGCCELLSLIKCS